jgi:hypothetical protein
VGAPLDLRREAVALAQRMAKERDTPTAWGVAAWGAVIEMVTAGAFDLAREELDSVTVPTDTPESMQLAGMLALSASLVVAAAKRPAEVEAALEYAVQLARRTGQGNAYLMGFGPTNVGLWQMAAALRVRDYQRAATIPEGVNPKAHPSRERRATYWMDYGRALARLPGRQDDVVRALRIAEELFPMRVLRNTPSPARSSGSCSPGPSGTRRARSCGDGLPGRSTGVASAPSGESGGASRVRDIRCR